MMAAAMFKKFSEKDNVSGSTQLKSSVQKSIRNQLMESYPAIADYMDQILPKKEIFKLIKCHDHIELLAGPTGDLLFFKSRDGPFIPTLRLLHQYPFIVPWQQVDKGAIKFLLKGSNVMCPGLTSAGGRLNPVDVDSVIVIMAEGKDHALAVGRMVMSHQDIKKTNAGIGIENIHYLNDGLWTMRAVK